MLRQNFGGCFRLCIKRLYQEDVVCLFVNGILISAVLQAVTSFILLRHQEALGSILLWTIGSLNGRVWIHLNLLWPIAVPALIAGLLTAGIANALWNRRAVSIVGAIGFIGLIGPHIAKPIVGEDARKSPIISKSIKEFRLGSFSFINRLNNCILFACPTNRPAVHSRELRGFGLASQG